MSAVHVGRREIVEVENVGPDLRVRYRWGDGYGDTGFAHSRATPIDRAILEDRWKGLVTRASDASKLQNRLDKLLYDLAAGLTRRDRHSSETALVDGEIVDVDHVLDIDGLEDVIRDWLIDHAQRVAL